MNAEPANLPVSPAEGRVSLGRVLRSLLVTVPLFGLAGVGFAYTDLNINQRMFVDALGCGCKLGFNTNELTKTIGLASLGNVLATWWLAASGLPWKVRLSLIGAAAVVLFFGFLVPFFRHNFWL